jgi:hypothetical protein
VNPLDDVKLPLTPDHAIPANALEVEDVTTQFQVAGGANRGPARIIVAKTGRASTNTEAYDLICAELSARGVSLENLHLGAAANRALGVVALRPSNMAAAGAIPVTVGEKVLRFHLGGVFKEHPALRPNTTVECAVDFTTDAKGRWCFTINSRHGTPKQAGTSTPPPPVDSQMAELARQKAALKQQKAELERQKAELARQQVELEQQFAELDNAAPGLQPPAKEGSSPSMGQ